MAARAPMRIHLMLAATIGVFLAGCGADVPEDAGREDPVPTESVVDSPAPEAPASTEPSSTAPESQGGLGESVGVNDEVTIVVVDGDE